VKAPSKRPKAGRASDPDTIPLSHAAVDSPARASGFECDAASVEKPTPRESVGAEPDVTEVGPAKPRKPERRAEKDRRTLLRCGLEPIAVDDPERWNRWRAELRGFTIEKAYCRWYWVVNGRMPIVEARALYAHPVGKTDIRVDGHCGCPAPGTPWTKWYLGDELIIPDPDGKQAAEWDSFGSQHLLGERPRFERYDVGAAEVVERYHIDSELGLYLFVEAVRALDPQR
jgi:hypothetical protein